MDYISRLLSEASAGTPSVSETKKASVLQATEQKKIELGGEIPNQQALYNNSVGAANNVGNAGLSPVMQDVRDASPEELISKYGPEGYALIAARSRANSQRMVDEASTRNFSQAAADTVSSAGMGVANGVLGIGALGAGIINKDAGAWMVDKIDKINEFGQDSQSPAMQASRRLYAAQNAEMARDTEAQAKANEAAGDNSFIVGSKKVGTDVVNTIKNLANNPMQIGDVVSQGIGSIATSGPVGKIIAKGAEKALEKKIGGKAAAALAGEKGSTTAAIGLTEGAGAYQQGSSEILKMSHDDLMKNSSVYREELAKVGDTPENRESIKNSLANKAGLISGALTAPAALLLGSMVAKFEANPTHVTGGIKSVLGNMGKEAIEEAGTGGAGQMASNFAVNKTGNENKELTDGVGEQIVQGAVGGLGAAGAMQGPGALIGGAVDAGTKVASTVGNAASSVIKTKNEAVQKANEQSSPVADTKVVDEANTVASTAAQASADLDLSPEPTKEDTVIKAHFDNVASAMAYDPEVETANIQDPYLKEIMGQSINSVDALHRATKVLLEESAPNEVRMDAARQIESLFQKINSGTQVDPALWESLPDEHPLVQQINDLDSKVQSIAQSPAVQKAFVSVSEAVNKAVEEKKITPITDTDANVEQKIADGVMAAKYADPTKLDPALPQNILFHAKKNNIQLPQASIDALNAADALVKAQESYTANALANNPNSKSEEVSEEITVAGPSGSKGDSFLSHFNMVKDAMNKGNALEAQGFMDDMAQFVQHMSNKVQALNEHYEGGNTRAPARPYQALNGKTRQWFSSTASPDDTKGMVVVPFDAKSVQLAQRVNREAQFGQNLYNALSNAYPQLQAGSAKVATLAQSLDGDFNKVVNQHKGKQADIGRQHTNAYSRSQTVVSGSPRAESTLGNAAENENPIPASAKKVKVKKHNLYVSEDGNTVWDVHGRKLTSDAWINSAKEAAGISESNAPVENQQESKPEEKQKVQEPNASDDQQDKSVKPKADESSNTQSQEQKESVKPATSKTPKVDDEPMKSELSDLREQLKDAQDEAEGSKEKLAAAQEELDKLSAKPEPDIKKAIFVAVKKPVRKITDTDRAKEKARLDSEVQEHNPEAPDEKLLNTYDLIGIENGDIEPWFAKAYRAPAKTISYLFGKTEGAFKAVTEALDNAGKLNNLRDGEPMKKNYSQDQKIAVANFIDAFGPVTVEAINKALKEKFLDKQMSKEIKDADGNKIPNPLSGKNYRESMEAGRDLIQDYASGKILAIANDNFELNQNLIESGVLAGLNYIIDGMKQTENLDPEDIPAIFGSTDEGVLINAKTMGQLTTTVDQASVIRQVADEIIKFWGVKENQDLSDTYVRGIAETVAANVLENLVDTTGLFETVILTADTIDGTPLKAARLKFNQPAIDKALSNQKGIGDLLQNIILTEPDDKYYFGSEAKVKSRDTQVRSNTPITEEQKEVQKLEGKNPFKFNTPMMGLYKLIGTDNLIRLLGGGELVGDRTLNDNYAKSLEGKNMAVRAALEQLEDMTAAAEQYAEETGKHFDDVEQFFEYAFTSVNRMHMQGRYNAQSNKTMREIIMPNESNLDLTNPVNKFNWIRSLSQALGVKVHNKEQAGVEKDFNNLVNNQFKPVIDLLVEQHFSSNDYDSDSINMEDTDSEFARELAHAIDTSFGNKATAAGIHALLDYARYLRATPDNRKSFRTMAYLEADGVTNGAANSMATFPSQEFTPTWVTNMAKVGLFFDDSNMNKHRSNTDKVDLYETAADNTKNSLLSAYNQVEDPKVKRAFADTLGILGDLSNDINVEFINGQLSLSMKRGFLKNPLTVTLYGSGKTGISAKIVNEMIADVFYERASNIAAVNPNMKMNHPEAGIHFFKDLKISDADKIKKYNRLLNAIDIQGSNNVKRTREGNLYTKAVNSPSKTDTPEQAARIRAINAFNDWSASASKFTFNPVSLNTLTGNTTLLITDHIDNGIVSTVGGDLMDSLDTVKNLTNSQSILMKHLFMNDLQNAIDEKNKNPLWNKTDFLSRNELKALLEKFKEFAPMLSTNRQNFDLTGRDKAIIKGMSFSRSLNDKMRTPALISGPTAAGVKGIPYLNIGMGDGLMMQVLSLMPELKGTLKIFDGMHMPVDKIAEYGEKANQAVIETWTKNNPLDVVLNSYSKAINALNEENNTLTDNQLREVTLAANPLLREIIDDMDRSELIASLSNASNRTKKMVDGAAARQEALTKFNFQVDQMAAAEAPAKFKGKTDLSGKSPEEIAAALNAEYKKIMAKKGYKDRSETTNKEFKEAINRTKNKEYIEMPNGEKAPIGTLNPAALKRFLGKIKGDRNQQVMLKEITRLVVDAGISVQFGSKEAIAQKLGADAPARLLDPTNDVSGWYDGNNKTLYLLKASTESMLHELIHATTYSRVLDFYNGKQVDTNTAESIQEIEILMEAYLADENPHPDLVNELNAIDASQQSEAVTKAMKLNEFMAWSLANKNISAQMEGRSLPEKAKQVAMKVFEAIRKLLWPKISNKNVPFPAEDNFLNHLQFHTGVIMRTQNKFGADQNEVNLFMSRKFGGSVVAEKTAEAMTAKLVEFLKPEAIVEGLRTDPNAPDRKAGQIKALSNAVTLTNSAISSGFQLNPLESKIFTDMVTVLGTGANIDPLFLAQSQTLYDHAIKNMNREDFMVDPTSQDPNDIAQAQRKFDLISGKAGVLVDNYGRSSVLPTFIALSMTSPEFNKVLSNIKTPKTAKNLAGTLDAALENIGNAGMDKLGEWASGQGMNQKNIANAMNAMANDLVRNHQDGANILVQGGDLLGAQVDKANNFFVQNMRKGADKLVNAANATNNKTVKNAAKFVAAVMSDTHASEQAEALNIVMGKVNGFHAVRDLLGDLIGRLDSNANVYDMVKTVRAMVQQTRQQYKEELPKTLRSKFSRELSKQEWNSLYNGLGKTDISALFGSLSNSGIKEIFTNPQKLVNEIAVTEQSIETLYPSNWLVLQAKSEQLAEYLNTGKTGNNLLRNAYAISSMLGERGFVKGNIPSQDLVNGIDKLVSLYAIKNMAMNQKQEIADLFNSEETGMNYLIGSLKAQRQYEIDKVANNTAIKMNSYKGYLPVSQAENTSVIVADYAQHAELLARGYKHIGDYVGSSLDQGSASMGYYLADHPTNSSFNQGIAQNVRLSSNGVDTVTGRTINLYGAGRVTNRALISRIQQNARRDSGNFRLMPVYNTDGEVISMERSFDPSIVTQSKPFQDLASSIGTWRGRQMEESMANEVNHKLVDNLYDMHRKDMSNGVHADSYVNILDPRILAKDPVLADAAKLLSNDIINYGQALFGKNKFLVRKDMLKETIGYREASLGDSFTGNTRWSKESINNVRSISTAIWGNDAYNKLTSFERNWQGLMHDARILIVVKSMIVPVANMVSNVLQLKGRGVSWAAITGGIPRKLKETEFYVQTQIEKIRLEADLAAETMPNQINKIQTRLNTINDAHKRLSIWPLIQAGEFSAISDVGVVSEEDADLVGGKLHQYVDSLVRKLPDGLRTVGRYAVISEDTALFRGLQKSVQYGDFLAKAILFEDMMTRQKLTKEEALAKITEEFVNYDILPGRNRGYLEKMGLMWFYNFKLRAAKIGFNMLRNNPLHSLIAMHIPTPDGLGAGLPISDSITGKLMNGAFTYSLGPGMGLRSPTLLPWINAVD